jgi:hypothetical protein
MQLHSFIDRPGCRAESALRTLVILALLFATIAIPARAIAQTGDAAVTVVTGNVQIVHSGKTLPATVGTAVFDGDEVDTAAASSATITLLDKSTLEIGEASKLKLDIPRRGAAASTTARIGLLAGVVRSFVTHAAAGGPPKFEVNTPNAVAAARGTKFDVAYQDNVDRKEFAGCHRFTDVAVYDGTVEVANISAPGKTVA